MQWLSIYIREHGIENTLFSCKDRIGWRGHAMSPKKINGTEFMRVHVVGAAYNTWAKGRTPVKVLMHELVWWVFRIKSGRLEQNEHGEE